MKTPEELRKEFDDKIRDKKVISFFDKESGTLHILSEQSDEVLDIQTLTHEEWIDKLRKSHH